MSNAPDTPPVPLPRRSRVVVAYGALTLAVLGGWIYARSTGWVPRTGSERATVPAGIRSSPGGYRAFHFWHSGYQGGK